MGPNADSSRPLSWYSWCHPLSPCIIFRRLRRLTQIISYWTITWERLKYRLSSPSFWLGNCSIGLPQPFQSICYLSSHHVVRTVIRIIGNFLDGRQQQVLRITEGNVGHCTRKPVNSTTTCIWLEANAGSSRLVLYAHFYWYETLTGLWNSVLFGEVPLVYLRDYTGKHCHGPFDKVPRLAPMPCKSLL